MIAEHLAELRELAESRMRDTAIIERKAGFDLDPDNGQQVDRWVAVGPQIKSRVGRAGVDAQRSQAAGQTVDRGLLQLRFPWWLADIDVEDRVTLTVSGDPRLLGVPIHVTEVEHATDAVERRVKGVVDEDRHV